jgi:hypothetical protein
MCLYMKCIKSKLLHRFIVFSVVYDENTHNRKSDRDLRSTREREMEDLITQFMATCVKDKAEAYRKFLFLG